MIKLACLVLFLIVSLILLIHSLGSNEKPNEKSNEKPNENVSCKNINEKCDNDKCCNGLQCKNQICSCLDEQHFCNDGDKCCDGLQCLEINGQSKKACMKTWDCNNDTCYKNQRKECDDKNNCVLQNYNDSSYVCGNVLDPKNTCISLPVSDGKGGVNAYCMDRENVFKNIPSFCKHLAQPNIFPK